MDNKVYKMLVINPGSTSTKVSYFENEKNVYTESVFHDAPVLLQFPTVNEQVPLRRAFLEDFMKRHDIDPRGLDALVARGGAAYSQESGVIEIDKALNDDTFNGCLLYTSPSPRDRELSRMPSSA